MRLDTLNTIVALLLAALLAYGCYALCGAEDIRILVTIASFVQLSVAGIGTFAISLREPRTTTLFRTLSGIFFALLTVGNGVAILLNITAPLYIVASGILLLIYIISGGAVIRAEQA